MNISKIANESSLTLALEGRLDTTTAPQLEQAINESTEGITALVFDLEKLQYVSSAGLRVLLAAQKRMNKQGSMTLKNVCSDIMEVFEITGFTEILTIE